VLDANLGHGHPLDAVLLHETFFVKAFKRSLNRKPVVSKRFGTLQERDNDG
jgi:hypothetical protein